MKCKVNGFWNSNGTGTNDQGQSFSWNNYFLSVTYADKKQTHMIGRKSKSLKVKAADLNLLLGLGLTQDGVINMTSEWLEDTLHLLGATVMIDFDDDNSIIDFEVLQSGSSSVATAPPENKK